MSQADALLATIEDTVIPHKHAVSDPDKHFVIDPDSRLIEHATSKPIKLMQNDHRSEIFTFELPRYVEGHDMLQCNRVRLYFINIGTHNRQQYEDAAELTFSVSPDDSGTIVAPWEIRRQATQYAGSLAFLIHFMCVEGDGSIDYEWHTDTFSDVEIKATRNPGEPIVFEYANILEDWYQRLFTAGNSVTAEAVAQIAAKAQETLASIPADYTAVAKMAEDATRKKANAIILEAESDVIFVNDASDSPLIGLRVFGKTAQAADPTPEAPKALTAVTNPLVTTYGKNLLDVDEVLTFEKVLGINVDLPAGQYILSFESETHGGAEHPEFRFYDNKIWNTLIDTLPSRVITLTKPETKIYIYSNGTPNANSEGVSATIKKLMVSKVEGDYEAFVEPQMMPTQRTLHGIPITSIGTYKDSAGQNWHADEIDFERGVYIQRVVEKLLDGSIGYSEAGTQVEGTYTAYCSYVDLWVQPGDTYLSDKFPCYPEADYKNSPAEGIYVNPSATARNLVILRISNDRGVNSLATLKTWLAANPIRVLCQLKTPIETPLTEEEITSFKMVCTNYHNTTVLNDAGAHMAIKYNADTLIFMRDNQPPVSDERLQAFVDAWLTKHFQSAEGVSF